MWGLWFIMTNHEIRIPINNPLLVWWQPGMLKKPTNLRHDSPGGGDPLQCFGGTARGVCRAVPNQRAAVGGGSWANQRIDPPQETPKMYTRTPNRGVNGICSFVVGFSWISKPTSSIEICTMILIGNGLIKLPIRLPYDWCNWTQCATCWHCKQLRPCYYCLSPFVIS